MKSTLLLIGLMIFTACGTSQEETVTIQKEELRIVDGDTTIHRKTEVVKKSELGELQEDVNKEMTVLVVDQKDFDSIVKAEPEAQFLDVRTKAEFNQGSIGNAENCDILNGDFEKRIATLDKQKPVLIYCRSGGRSTKARNLLIENEFEYIVELEKVYSQYKK